jgi:hypothetical protein
MSKRPGLCLYQMYVQQMMVPIHDSCRKWHLNGANLIERFDGANAAVHAQDALVEDGGDRQVVKQRLWRRAAMVRSETVGALR